MTTFRYTVSLGSNDSDRRHNIDSAVRKLDEFGTVRIMSDIYETPAANGLDADYLNAVAVVESRLNPVEFIDSCKTVERLGGRSAASKVAGRIPIDIDVVLVGSTVLRPADFSQKYFTLGYSQIIAHERNSTTD